MNVIGRRHFGFWEHYAIRWFELRQLFPAYLPVRPLSPPLRIWEWPP